MISDDFKYFVSINGNPSFQQHVNPDDIEKYRSAVPSALFNFWLEMGWGDYADGLLRIRDPSLLNPILELLLGNDSQLRPEDCTLYAHSVFGDLFIWNRLHGRLVVNLLTYNMDAPRALNPTRRMPDDREIAVPLIGFKKDKYDCFDTSGVALFDRACKALGYPGPDECFGFFPALPLGGERVLGNIKRVKAREHFGILAQLRRPKLIDYRARPPIFVREI